MAQRFPTPRCFKRWTAFRILTALSWLALLTPAGVKAGDDAVLERLLLSGSDFRVRARAAAALARSQSPHAGPALEAALVDRHPAVRQAAATALGQLRATEALPALRASVRDPAPLVAQHARESIAIIERNQRGAPGPSGAKRYGLFVGELRDNSAEPDPSMLTLMSTSLDVELGDLSGAALVDTEAAPRDVPLYRIDGTVLEIARSIAAHRVSSYAVVVLWLVDEADKTMQIVFKGAATAIEEPDPHTTNQSERVTRLALRRAVRAALRNANEAISGGLDRPRRRTRQPQAQAQAQVQVQAAQPPQQAKTPVLLEDGF